MNIESQSRIPKKEEGRERIVSPALRYRDEIFTGENHGAALTSLEDAEPYYEEENIEEGYVTSTGRFVERKEGYRIAVENEQIEKSLNFGMLTSDDFKS